MTIEYLAIARKEAAFCHGYVSLAASLYDCDPAIAVCLTHTRGAQSLLELPAPITPKMAAKAVQNARRAMDVAGYRARELKAIAPQEENQSTED